jgi:hypothetical protein
MKTRQQSARGGFLAGNVKFIGSNKTAHTRLFQIRLYEGHRVKAHRRGLRDLPEEELLRGLEWHTDVGSKSPRAEISDFVTTYNSYDALTDPQLNGHLASQLHHRRKRTRASQHLQRRGHSRPGTRATSRDGVSYIQGLWWLRRR